MALSFDSLIPRGQPRRSEPCLTRCQYLRKRYFESAQVEIGLDKGTYVQITKGLKAGEKVVVYGTLPLQGEAQKKAGGIK